MPARTVKGDAFSICVDGKQIIVKHVHCKGKRCRVFLPEGATIEVLQSRASDQIDVSDAISGVCTSE